MPFVQVQHLAGAFSREQQTALIKDITEAFVRISGDRIRPNVLITVTEIESGLWATGGVPLTIEDIKKRQAERQAAQT